MYQENSIYNKPEVYDLHFNDRKREMLHEYYKRILEGKEIYTIHDCSYGTGNLTDELARMGYKVSGSDLSSSMIQQGVEKNRQEGLAIDLTQCDFRNLTNHIHNQFDCVMSTGNSLAHVSNDDVKIALKEMTSLIKDGGYIYIDLRNWDRILETNQRFFYYPPIIKDNERINTIQVWDYNLDGTMTFNLLYTFEKDHQIYHREEFKVVYYPLKKDFLIQELKNLGFKDICIMNFIHDHIKDFNNMEWYVIMAKKSID
ncbi:class I SAM-dependent methyltransferase [Alkaliphilus transvaalensis]|uniref:class I SAM-dependent methyltransferase n=1 Tax=Alkaliphilus transvaalensis TaxID=114628 RepID=UPI00055750F2|nr:class I SAM-dependent methyltransferase [Alkaliphilus transvaalensis]